MISITRISSSGRLAVLALVLVGLVVPFSKALAQRDQVLWMPAQTEWVDYPPPQAPHTEGYVNVDGVNLWYWDTGGDGEAVVLIHPSTTSAAAWGYQQPALAAAGFRVIAYSRRGHHKSDAGPLGDTGNALDDLHSLVNHLQLDRFHLVGVASGGSIVSDYALSYPERLLSITISNSDAAIRDAELDMTSSLLPTPELSAMPTWYNELGPSYRAGNPEGVAQWIALHEMAITESEVVQGRVHLLDREALAGIEIPTLLVTGDADLYEPPTKLLFIASLMTESPKLVVLSDAGHSGYWEQPEAFNKVLIDFMKQYSLQY